MNTAPERDQPPQWPHTWGNDAFPCQVASPAASLGCQDVSPAAMVICSVPSARLTVSVCPSRQATAMLIPAPARVTVAPACPAGSATEKPSRTWLHEPR